MIPHTPVSETWRPFEASLVDELSDQSNNWVIYSELVNDTYTNPHTVIRDSYMYVARVNHDGADLIIRKPGKQFGSSEDPFEDEASITARLRALQRTKGISGVEQLLAFSVPELAIVTEAVAGSTLDDLNVLDAEAMTTQQFQDLIDTFEYLQKSKIEIDHNLDNFIYNSDDGFVAIDYRLQDEISVDFPPGHDFCNLLELLSEQYYFKTEDELGKPQWRAAILRGREALLSNYPDIFKDMPTNLFQRKVYATIRDIEYQTSET